MPLISINILTKNRAEQLAKALLSVGRQTFNDYEVVIVNDGSTDSTSSVIEDLYNQGMPIKLIEHVASVGVIAGRQEALYVSEGKYVAMLDDDEEWVDVEKLKKQTEFLENNPDCVLVGGGMVVQSQGMFKFKQKIKQPETHAALRRGMLFGNHFFLSTVMFRKDAALQAGGFVSDGDDFCEDYDLWLRMGKLGKFHNLAEPLALSHHLRSKRVGRRAYYKKQFRLITRHREDYPLYFLAASWLQLKGGS